MIHSAYCIHWQTKKCRYWSPFPPYRCSSTAAQCRHRRPAANNQTTWIILKPTYWEHLPQSFWNNPSSGNIIWHECWKQLSDSLFWANHSITGRCFFHEGTIPIWRQTHGATLCLQGFCCGHSCFGYVEKNARIYLRLLWSQTASSTSVGTGSTNLQNPASFSPLVPTSVAVL